MKISCEKSENVEYALASTLSEGYASAKRCLSRFKAYFKVQKWNYYCTETSTQCLHKEYDGKAMRDTLHE